MTRRRISSSERAKIFTKECGVCHLCEGKIEIGQGWDVSHEIPLALGGDDCGDNLRVAHRKCHQAHTAKQDAPRIAKAKRVAAKHTGAKKPKGGIPYRKFDGTPVWPERQS